MLYADFREEHETLAARENEFRGKPVVVVGKEIHEIESGEQGAQLLTQGVENMMSVLDDWVEARTVSETLAASEKW
ncbi:MAG TPA: hypothetical protein EYP49_19435 [Anaerolineae bacterium]|nr:hypothetical protein [Anaerolineae bacterium]